MKTVPSAILRLRSVIIISLVLYSDVEELNLSTEKDVSSDDHDDNVVPAEYDTSMYPDDETYSGKNLLMQQLLQIYFFTSCYNLFVAVIFQRPKNCLKIPMRIS